jgi:hypothetical protein
MLTQALTQRAANALISLSVGADAGVIVAEL